MSERMPISDTLYFLLTCFRISGPCLDENGKAYPLTTVVDCEEDEIQCQGVSPGNDCPGQDLCVPRGVDKNGELCEGFCPPEQCKEDQMHCLTPSDPITGCAQPAV